MKNFFQNVDNKVERFSTGIKELNQYNSITTGAAAHSFLEKNAVLEHTQGIDKSAELSEKAYEEKKKISAVQQKSLLESQILSQVNKLNQIGKDVLFKEIVFEMFTNALVLDEDFILEQTENLKAVVDEYIDANGGFKLLESAVRRTGSPLLKNIKNVCEACAKNVVQRKVKQTRESTAGSIDEMDLLNFKLDDDEQKSFNYEKQNIGIDELSGLVKNKVLTVVQDEKQRESDQEELYNDIESQLQDDESVTTEEAAKEALSKIAIKQNVVEETTLFNALIRHSYKEALENVAVSSSNQKAINDGDEDDSDFKVNNDLDDIKQDEFKEQTTADIEDSEYKLSKEISDVYPDDEDNIDQDMGQDDFDIDMDVVLAEAVTKYTLMELAYTINLEQYSVDTVRKISQKLVN